MENNWDMKQRCRFRCRPWVGRTAVNKESVKSSLDSVEPYRSIFAFLEGMRGLLYRTSASMNSVDPTVHAEQIHSHMWDPLDSWG